MPTALSGHEGTRTKQEFPSNGSDSLDTDLAQDHFPKGTSPGSVSGRVPHDFGMLSWARSSAEQPPTGRGYPPFSANRNSEHGVNDTDSLRSVITGAGVNQGGILVEELWQFLDRYLILAINF